MFSFLFFSIKACALLVCSPLRWLWSPSSLHPLLRWWTACLSSAARCHWGSPGPGLCRPPYVARAGSRWRWAAPGWWWHGWFPWGRSCGSWSGCWPLAALPSRICRSWTSIEPTSVWQLSGPVCKQWDSIYIGLISNFLYFNQIFPFWSKVNLDEWMNELFDRHGECVRYTYRLLSIWLFKCIITSLAGV